MRGVEHLPVTHRAAFLAQVREVLHIRRQGLEALPVSRQTWWRWQRGGPVRRAQAVKVAQHLDLEFEFIKRQRSRVKLFVPEFERALSVRPVSPASILRAERDVLYAVGGMLEAQGMTGEFVSGFGLDTPAQLALRMEHASHARIVLGVAWTSGVGYILHLDQAGSSLQRNRLMSGSLSVGVVSRLLSAVQRLTALETAESKRGQQLSRQLDNFFKST